MFFLYFFSSFFDICKLLIPAVSESVGDSLVLFKPSSCVVLTPTFSSQNGKMAKGHPISRKMIFRDA